MCHRDRSRPVRPDCGAAQRHELGPRVLPGATELGGKATDLRRSLFCYPAVSWAQGSATHAREILGGEFAVPQEGTGGATLADRRHPQPSQDPGGLALLSQIATVVQKVAATEYSRADRRLLVAGRA